MNWKHRLNSIWNKFGYTNFHELNLDYFIKVFTEIFEEWETLYDDMLSWKNNVDERINELLTRTEEILDTYDEWVSTTQENTQKIEILLNDTQILKSQTLELYNNKVDLPISPESKFGQNGQVLSTLGNGKTKWVDRATVSNAQAETYINNWLDDHPEATTTVQDGSITFAKFSPSLQDRVDNTTINPEYYGALGNGIVDDTDPIQSALNFSQNNVSRTVLCAKTYLTENSIYINSKTTIILNKLVYTGADAAIIIDGGQDINIYFSDITALSGTAIRFAPTVDKNNMRINIYGGTISAKTGIEMISDPTAQTSPTLGNQNISIFGVNIRCTQIGIDMSAIISGARIGWNGEICYYGGSIQPYATTNLVTAIKNTGMNTGFSIENTSLERCDIYYNLGGQFSKFSSINCRDERTQNPNNAIYGTSASWSENAAVYPIIITPAYINYTRPSVYYFYNTRYLPTEFSITDYNSDTSLGRAYITLETAMTMQNGIPDTTEGWKYSTNYGWTMSQSIYASARYTSTIANRYIQEYTSSAGIAKQTMFPVFGYKTSTGNVNLPISNVKTIRANGSPVYEYIAGGNTLTIGSDLESESDRDVFTVTNNSFIMLLPVAENITYEGKLVKNGLIPIVMHMVT